MEGTKILCTDVVLRSWAMAQWETGWLSCTHVRVPQTFIYLHLFWFGITYFVAVLKTMIAWPEER